MMFKEPAKKKNISTACTWCRNRKVKCDGQSPRCSNCILYSQECEYNYHDKRRQSHKKTNESLTKRVAFLEGLLHKHGIEIPPENESDSPQAALKLDSNSAPTIRSDGVTTTPEATTLGIEEWVLYPGNIKDSTNTVFDMDEDVDFHLNYNNVEDLLGSLTPSWTATNSFSQVGNEGLEQISKRNTLGKSDVPDTVAKLSSSINVNTAENKLPNATGFACGSEQRIIYPTSATIRAIGRNSMDSGSGSNQLGAPQSVPSFCDSPSVDGQDDDEIINKLSARMGSFQIAEDGQLRYFGATSNLHILQNGLSSFSRHPDRTVRIEGKQVLSRAGLDISIEPDQERHLEDLYFQWEDPAIHVVDQQMYFIAKRAYYAGQEETPFYSETLQNSICAAGSDLVTRTDLGLPQDATAIFSSRARLLLEVEMDSPSIATVQALVIMSATEAASTRDSRGWLYSGMAVRLTADLGLHLDLSHDVNSGIISDHELDVRRTTFWGVFIHDNMWSTYVGRSHGLNIQDVSLPRPPKHLDKLRSKKWNPSVDPIGSGSISIQKVSGLYDPVEAHADASVSLCLMMRTLSKTVYSEKTLSTGEFQQLATRMRVELDLWYETLPVELQVNPESQGIIYLPHIIQLHMQFHAISILLHRPFFSRSLQQVSGYDNQSASYNPRNVCVSAAQAMVKLLRIYRDQHTLRRTNVHIVHLVFTASLICIYGTYSSSGSAATETLRDLQFCCQALGEIGQAYQNAVRALEVIICIKREWLSKPRNYQQFKRRTSILEDESTHEKEIQDTRRKRRLTQSHQDSFSPIISKSVGINTSDRAYTTYGAECYEQGDDWYAACDTTKDSIPVSALDNMFPSA